MLESEQSSRTSRVKIMQKLGATQLFSRLFKSLRLVRVYGRFVEIQIVEKMPFFLKESNCRIDWTPMNCSATNSRATIVLIAQN